MTRPLPSGVVSVLEAWILLLILLLPTVALLVLSNYTAYDIHLYSVDTS